MFKSYAIRAKIKTQEFFLAIREYIGWQMQ